MRFCFVNYGGEYTKVITLSGRSGKPGKESSKI